MEDDFLYSLYTTENQCPRTTTLYFEVATKYNSVLLNTTKYYPVLPRISKYYKIFLRTKYDSALPETTSYYKVQLPPTKCVKECCKVQQSTTTEYYSALQCTTLKYKVALQSTTLKYKVVKSTTLLLCFWAYTCCHVTCAQLTINCEPLQASALSFLFKNGEFAVILIPQPRLQDLQKGGNKSQHPKDANLLGHCSKTMRVTCVAVSLNKLEPERARAKLSHNMAVVFVNTKTHFSLKQVIIHHVHETTQPTSLCTSPKNYLLRTSKYFLQSLTPYRHSCLLVEHTKRPVHCAERHVRHSGLSAPTHDRTSTMGEATELAFQHSQTFRLPLQVNSTTSQNETLSAHKKKYRDIVANACRIRDHAPKLFLMI